MTSIRTLQQSDHLNLSSIIRLFGQRGAAVAEEVVGLRAGVVAGEGDAAQAQRLQFPFDEAHEIEHEMAATDRGREEARIGTVAVDEGLRKLGADLVGFL